MSDKQNETVEEGFDPFEDDTAGSAADKPEAEITTEKRSKEVEEEVEGQEDEQTDDKDEGAATSADTDEKDQKLEDIADDKPIPAHRFKAALKKVTEERDAWKNKAEEANPIPVPDKAADPEGFAFHNRMESSKELMRELVPDYDDVVSNYAAMAEANPLLNQAVFNAKNPAKFAYDLVKKALEVNENANLKKSDEYKEFLEFKKGKKGGNNSEDKNLNKQVVNGLSKVPNLNRSTNVAPGKQQKSDDDDGLFEGAL